MGDWVNIARIVKTRGIRGEVAAELLTDFPERFSQLSNVQVTGPEGIFQVELERFWFHQGRVILKFKSLDRPHEAKHLVGGLVQVSEEERIKLPEGTFFHDQLVGCRVVDAGELLGTVGRVVEMAPLEAQLMVDTPDGVEVIVPLIRQFVKSVDLESSTIETCLPPGLKELNQPASRNQTKRPK